MATSKLIANRFQVEEMIGRGGMGEVFRGEDLQTREPVAIKILKSEFVEHNPEIVERFDREGKALRKLNHPNIVKVLAAFEEDGNHYIVMELVAGGTLADLLHDEGQLPVPRVLAIGLELADALSRAHHLKIIHRDIKPSNVLLADDGTPRLTDFGVARFSDSNLTELGVTVGTFDYLSPEAARGEAPDVRADIWSFGLLLYLMLAGRHPYDEAGTPAVITALLTRPIPDIEQFRPGLPVALVDLIQRMMEKNREARIPRMRMVAAELEAIIDSLDTSSRPFTVLPPDSDRAQLGTPPSGSASWGTDTRYLPPHDLPAFTTPFVGRDHELRTLQSWMEDPATRLITLVGAGGIGKTRVAVALANRQVPYFIDGTYYIPLAPVADPAHIVSTIAEHIQFTFGGTSDPRAELLDYLREKHMLLVFDNFEHLTDHAAIVADILRAAPGVKVLVASRERLRLRGERVYDLLSMILPEGDKKDELVAYPAVQLFLSTAQRVMPSFALDDSSAPLVAQVCRLVDGMPLGIELAAGWLEMVPLEEIVAEIETSLDFLETDLQDVPTRHRSLRAMFESTWHLLTPTERDTFARLSVFRGGFTRDAAQKVADAPLRTLTALVNKSLLRRMPDGRFLPHLLLRQYAEEIFQAASADTLRAVHNAHAVYYASVLREMQPRFNTRQEVKAMELIESEIENVRAAWQWAQDNACWAELETMLHPLFLYDLLRSALQEGEATFRTLAERLDAAGEGNTPLYWRARARQGLMAGRLGDYATMHTLNEEALAFFEAHDDPFERVFARHNLSYVAMMQGHYEDACRHASDALAIAQTLDDNEALLGSLGNLGYAEYLRGNYEEAARITGEFVTRSAAGGSPISQAFGLNNLGEIHEATGDLETAAHLYDEAYAIFKTYRHRRGMAFTLANLGATLYAAGDYTTARARYEEAYDLNKAIGDRAGLARTLSALGHVALASNDPATARQHFEESLAIRQAIGDRKGAMRTLEDLAAAARAAGDEAAANQLDATRHDLQHETD